MRRISPIPTHSARRSNHQPTDHHEVPGHRHPPHSPRRHRQGDWPRPLRRRPYDGRPAPRPRPAQSTCPRRPGRHQDQQGVAAAGRRGRCHFGRPARSRRPHRRAGRGRHQAARPEQHNATALWNADGTVTIWCSTQGAFTVRAQVAELLQMPLSKIKVVPMEIGGGFGGKIRVYLEPVAAALSKKTGKPVKVLMNRADVFEGTGPTPGSFIRVKLGADKNGRLVAGEAYLAYEAGAYPGSPVGPGAMCIFACYDIPNVMIDGYDVVVNKPATAAYRAPGATQAAFAAETVVDEICQKLKIDPLDFRLLNASKEGTRRADGPVFPKVGNL